MSDCVLLSRSEPQPHAKRSLQAIAKPQDRPYCTMRLFQCGMLVLQCFQKIFQHFQRIWQVDQQFPGIFIAYLRVPGGCPPAPLGSYSSAHDHGHDA